MQHRAEYKLFYRTTTTPCSTALPDPSPPAAPPTNNCFKPYTSGSVPDDLATTTSAAGTRFRTWARIEGGTMNRGIYDIAVLFETDQAVDGARSAVRMERQGRLQLRGIHGSAATPVPNLPELG